VNRQRIVALSAGTQEFWVVDAERRTVQLTDRRGAHVYSGSDAISLALFGEARIVAEHIFS
jgi:hypothetical protein